MLYKLAHLLRDHCPWLWDIVDRINAYLFVIRYKRRLKDLDTVLTRAHGEYNMVRLSADNVAEAADFFQSQPADAFTYFHPHAFDQQSLHKLAANPSFLAFLVMHRQQIVGYFFLRSFFIGNCYLGKMVDATQQGKGIGQMMCRVAMKVALMLNMRMFETISKHNLASLYSSQRVLKTRVVKEMADDYFLIEDVGFAAPSAADGRNGR